MAGSQWTRTPYPGVRYREHPTRVHEGKPDRYYALRYYRDGKRIEEGLGWQSDGWTAKKAAAVRGDLEKAHTTGDGPATLGAKRQARRDREAKAAAESAQRVATYRELCLEHYIPWAKREKKSAWMDEIRLNNHLYAAFGDLTLEAITVAHVERFRDMLLETWSRSTVKQILALLRKTINHFALLGLYDRRNPVSCIKMPRLDNECERFLTREEYDRLLDVCCEAQCTELHDAVILAVHTGLRLGEIYRLDACDVDLSHGFLTVREDDGKPGGKVPLNEDVLPMLARRLAGKTRGAVFPQPDKRGKALSKQFTWLAWSIGLNSGDEDRQHRLTFHSLRHTFASWLALADVDLYRIQRLMRHKTAAMTQRYAHLRPSWLRDDVANLCRRPPSPPGPEDV